MNNEKILAHVRMFVLREKLLCPGEPLHLAAAVSGGADSMALLRILLALQPEFGFVLSACHVNHGLRGESADRDEAFVRAECARLGVPLRVFHAAEMADEVGLPSEHAGEDWARRLRYACFARLCGEGIDVVATAHTANDQAETLLLRLARGTGLHGAAGIRPKRGCYLRPLLALTRQDTESFCRAAGQAWVTDETNATDAYARNRIRHYAVPALQTINPAAERAVGRLCNQLQELNIWLENLAEKLLAQAACGGGYSIPILAAADAPVLAAALRMLAARARDPEEKYVQALAAIVRQGSGAVQLTDRVRFCAGDGCFWQEIVPERPRQQEDKRPESQPFQPEKQAEYCLAGGWKVTAGLFTADFEEKIQVVHKKDLKNQADYARITTLYAGLVLRTRQPGDVYRPAGRSVHNRLRKWMNETGIPASQRDQLPLLAAGSEVLWVCGAGFAEGLAPDADTAQVLQMEMEHREEIT